MTVEKYLETHKPELTEGFAMTSIARIMEDYKNQELEAYVIGQQMGYNEEQIKEIAVKFYQAMKMTIVKEVNFNNWWNNHKKDYPINNFLKVTPGQVRKMYDEYKGIAESQRIDIPAEIKNFNRKQMELLETLFELI